MKLTSNEILRASIKRILITIALIITLIILVGFITISYIVGNSMVEPKNNSKSYSQFDTTLLLIKKDFLTKLDSINQTINSFLNKNDH
ncbi:hypothetical protein [Bacillus sp. OAE603]|uniref:hypothetical protein n=1 Tax=Gottfriedia sp. OAE603 TaxID=2663872 RepID=UPI00178BD89C